MSDELSFVRLIVRQGILYKVWSLLELESGLDFVIGVDFDGLVGNHFSKF